jgi:membrane-bound ClpP family serine protease
MINNAKNMRVTIFSKRIYDRCDMNICRINELKDENIKFILSWLNIVFLSYMAIVHSVLLYLLILGVYVLILFFVMSQIYGLL